MIYVLVGLLVVAVPLSIAASTVVRLLRVLGAVDAADIAEAIDRDPQIDLVRLCRALEREAQGSIAQRLVSAAVRDEGRSLLDRQVAFSEEIADIERRVAADIRVPRVAASLATTGGLLAAALVMRQGLGVTVPEGVDPVPVFYKVIEQGLTLASLAVLGGVVCAALHRSAQRLRKERLAELDALTLPLSTRVFGTSE